MKKLCFILVFFTSFAWAATPVVELSEVLTQIKSPQSNVVILDVRSAEEYAEGHIPGAMNIDYRELGQHLTKLSAHKNDKIIVHCRSGRRAAVAEKLLINNGFSQVYHLKGDMLGWQEAKHTVTK